MEGLALSRLYLELGIEDIEELLRQFADTVIDREDHYQGRRTHSNTHQRNPGDDVDDAFLLAGEEITACYEGGGSQWYGLLFKQFFDMGFIVEGVVDIELKGGNDAQLLAFSETQSATQVGGIGPYGGHHLVYRNAPDGEDAYVDAGQAEVGGNSHGRNGNKRIAEHGFHFLDENVAQVLLYES